MLIDNFPDLTAPLDTFTEQWVQYCEPGDDGWPGLYNLWGDVVLPQCIEPLLADIAEDHAALSLLFNVVESMAANGDQYVRTFVRFGICERIGDFPNWLIRSRRYMGPHTRAISEEVEAALGRSTPSSG